MSIFTAEQIQEFKDAIASLARELVVLDEKFLKEKITHKNQWRYCAGFDYDFNFYEDFTKNLRTNQQSGDGEIYYADQLWDSFFEKYDFRLREVSPFFNKEYVDFYFGDEFSGKTEKVINILTKFRQVKLREDLISPLSPKSMKNKLKI